MTVSFLLTPEQEQLKAALTERRGGPVPIIEYQAVSDVLADAKGKIEAVRLLAWRALDAVLSMHPSGPELALHAKIFGSETGVEVVNNLIKIVGVRRRQLPALFRTPGYDRSPPRAWPERPDQPARHAATGQQIPPRGQLVRRPVVAGRGWSASRGADP